MTTHEEILNAMLNSNCSQPVDNMWNEYRFEGCCVTTRIIARPLTDGSGGWQIMDWTQEDA